MSKNSINDDNLFLQTTNIKQKGVFKSKIIDDEVEWRNINKVFIFRFMSKFIKKIILDKIVDL